jgi:hypothetical protein
MARSGPKIKQIFDKLKYRVTKVFICRHKSCGKQFNKYRDWANHNIEHTCPKCTKTFAFISRHICKIPDTIVGGNIASNYQSQTTDDLDLGRFQFKHKMHNSSVLVFILQFKDLIDNFSEAVSNVQIELTRILNYYIAQYKGIVVTMNFATILENVEKREQKTRTYFTPYIRYINSKSIFRNLQSVVDYVTVSVQLSSSESGSGWKLDSVTDIELKIGKFSPLHVASYVDFPKEISYCRKYCINIKTRTGNCFVYSVIASLFETEILSSHFPGKMVYAELTEVERKRFKRILEDPLTYVNIKDELESNNKMVLTPFVGVFDVSQIEQFERINNISILLLGHEDKRFYPINTVSIKREKHVDLLVLKKRKEIDMT